MSSSNKLLDPITLEVIHNGLRSIADETYIALKKSAYSTNIKERDDHSTCLMDARGRVIVQAERAQAIHLSSMSGHVRKVLECNSGGLREGDIFISNDPYEAGGSHLPDVNFAMPVFVQGHLMAFSCSIAHHADIGGMTPGSMSADMTEIYQEGLRIPVVRLFEEGRLVRDVLNLVLLNVRMPEERKGDYLAQVAACRLGERRFKELASRYDRRSLESAFDDIIARTTRRIRRSIAKLPPGRYTFEDVMDDDGHGTKNIAIKVAATIAGDRLSFDFAGTAPQVKGNINCPFADTRSMVGLAVKGLLDPTMPNNQGVMDTVELSVEPGTLLNPTFPAAVAFRTHTCQRVVDVILGALAPAIPDAVIAAGNGANTTAIFAGIDPRNGRRYLFLETLAGGCGARSFKDGKDGVQLYAANSANMAVEAFETAFPILIDRYEFAADTGGAGKFRGGLGLRRVYRPLAGECLFVGSADRFSHAPWGLFDAGPGASGQYVVVDEDGRETALSSKPRPLVVRAGQRVVVQSPGAGGYGDPHDRDRRFIARDLRSGKFGASFIERNYGLAATQLHAVPIDDLLDFEETLLQRNGDTDHHSGSAMASRRHPRE
jgi:N-methylhydantoinase B